MENEENLQFPFAFKQRYFISKAAVTMPVGLLLTQQTVLEIKDLEVMKNETQKGEKETDVAVISLGNFTSFSRDL